MGWGDDEPGTGMQNYAKPQKGSGGMVDDPGGPNSHPEYGPRSDAWRQAQGEANMDVIEEAGRRQDMLENGGFKYDSSNGTWKAPDGRTTTMFGDDPGPPKGGVDYHWDRQQPQHEGGDNPYGPRQIEGREDDIDGDLDEEGEDDPAMRGFAKFTLWGWLLTKLGKQAR
jgi:hypothetical protein